ncbi:Arc family DNA-binding protein [Mesorhizobium sp. M0029]|uniref:Arc family DNA-binding protein n=1 Tax=Mesorhizobium sp. M0029 TaxID=2956850 RepID=UPI003335C244
MSRADPKFLVRLPADVKAFIATQAARNGSSQNSAIVRCIRNRMDETKTTTSEPASSI